MMGNMSKTAEPSVFIFGTNLRVAQGHHILIGVRLPLLSRNEPQPESVSSHMQPFGWPSCRLRRLPGLV